MKKYKLIKNYPGAPALGTVVEAPQITSHTLDRYDTEEISVKDEASEYPEFWEELPGEKTCLFTTEDGVDIKEGDEYWWVDDSSFNMTYNICKRETDVVSCNTKQFSTIAAAEEYILYNKPSLSINDVKEVYIQCYGGYSNMFLDELKNKANE